MYSTAKRKTIELVFDDDCPHVEAARRLLCSVLDEARLPRVWLEWSRQNPDTPDPLLDFGSPTILVDGVDVASTELDASATVDSPRCRVYPDANGRLGGVPPRQHVLEALVDRT